MWAGRCWGWDMRRVDDGGRLRGKRSWAAWASAASVTGSDVEGTGVVRERVGGAHTGHAASVEGTSGGRMLPGPGAMGAMSG